MAEKKTVSAKAVIADIRAGATDEFLMNKYALSEKGLQSIFQKLITAKVITQAELDRRAFTVEEVEITEDIPSPPAPKGEPLKEDSFVARPTQTKTPVEAARSQEPPKEDAKTRWYESGIIVFPLLILCFPIGLYFLWKSQRFMFKTKAIATAVVGVICMVGILSPKEKTATTVPPSKPPAVAAEQKVVPQSTQPQPEPAREQSKPVPAQPDQKPPPPRSAQPLQVAEPVVGSRKPDSKSEEPPIPFPVSFQKEENRNTKEFFAKVIRFCVIADKDPSQFSLNNHRFEDILKEILASEYACQATKELNQGPLSLPNAITVVWRSKLRKPMDVTTGHLKQ